MKPWGGLLLTLLAVLPGLDAAAQSRAFTNREGQTIEAEITTVRDGKVYLKQGGRTYAVAVDQLSEKDQAFIRNWVKDNFKYNLSFRADPSELKDKRTSRRDGKKEKWESEVWNYGVEITNRSGVDLENVTVDYRVLIRDESISDPGRGRKTKKETSTHVGGSKKFPKLNNTASASFSTQEIPLKEHEKSVQRSQTSYSSGEREVEYWWDNFSEDSKLDGIWLRVYLEDRLIGEWKSQGKLIKDHQWAYEKKAPPVARSAPPPRPRPVAVSKPPATKETPAGKDLPKPPKEEPASVPAPEPGKNPEEPVADHSGGNGGPVLADFLLSKRIQDKLREIRRNPDDEDLILEYRQLLLEQKRFIGRWQPAG